MMPFSSRSLSAATPGLGRLAMALGGGGESSFEKARQGELTFQSRLAQAIASQQASQATTRLNDLKADAEAQEQAARRPEVLRRNAMTVHGVPLEEESAVTSFIDRGSLGPKYEIAPELAGPVAPRPDWAGNLGKVAQMLGLTQNAIGMGDKNSGNVVEGMGKIQDQGLVDAAVAAAGKGDDMGLSRLNAIRGKKEFTPFAAVGNTGTALNQVTGTQPVANQGLNQLFTNEGQARIGAQKANAVQSYAAAGASNASAAKTKADTQRDARGADIIQVMQPDGTVLLVNKVTGLSRPAVSQDGKPVLGKGAPGTAGNAKPMSATALRMQMEELDAIGTASGIDADLESLVGLIDSGKLALGPVSNLINEGRNLAGMSSEESRNLQTFKATLEKLRNDSLRLNKGVQTDGDAQRAWNELLTNINDPDVVRQRLQDVRKLNQRAVQLRKLGVETIRANFNQPPLDTAGHEGVSAAIGDGAAPAPRPAGGALPKISSDSEYNALPAGAEFLAPDGSRRRKP